MLYIAGMKTKNILVVLIFVVILISSSCSMLLNFNDEYNHEEKYDFDPPITEFTSRADVMNLSDGTTYYLDSNEGDDDSGDGSSLTPWMSIEKVLTVITPGDRVILRTGNYTFDGDPNDNGDRSKYTVFINEEGEEPIITNLYLSYGTYNYVYDDSMKAKYVFFGINFKTVDVDPGSVDPFDLDADQNTYIKSDPPIEIYYADDIKFVNCKIEGSTNKNLTAYAVRMKEVLNITFESCEVTRAQALFNFYGKTHNLTFLNNYLHDMCRSCFLGNDGDVENIVIQGNHITNAEWYEGVDPYVPQGDNRYHGSAIAMRNGGYIIRNNIIHNGWNSSGISAYGNTDNIPDSGAYHDILIENNLIYDLREDTAAIRMYWLGENIVIRNNTLIGSYDDSLGICYEHYSAITLYSLGYDSGMKTNKIKDGSGIHIHNNICAGMVSIYEDFWDSIDETRNIFWSVEKDHYASTSQEKFLPAGMLSSGSKVLVTYNSSDNDYFRSGFFNIDPDLRAYSEIGSGNHETQDFTLAGNSEGVNYGSILDQPQESLGSLLLDRFVLYDGEERNHENHNIGCYE